MKNKALQLSMPDSGRRTGGRALLDVASSGTLIAWAQRRALPEAANLLSETLEEEKATDHALTELAKF